jgi:hypothetical protein
MPQVAAPKLRITRATVRTVWWAFVSGVVACALAASVVGGARSGREGYADEWSDAVLLLALAAVAVAIVSYRLMVGLPAADHPVFDAVGDRFVRAAEQLFVRFVLAGATAEATALIGLLLVAFGGAMAVAWLLAILSLVLLHQLRRRIAPLVHYLA